MSHSKTLFCLLPSILFLIIHITCFSFFLFGKQSLSVHFTQASLELSIVPRLLEPQVQGLQAEAPHPAAHTHTSKVRHGRVKEKPGASEVAWWIGVLTARPTKPSLIPRAHIRRQGGGGGESMQKKKSCKLPLRPHPRYHSTHAHTNVSFTSLKASVSFYNCQKRFFFLRPWSMVNKPRSLDASLSPSRY